MSGLFGSTTIKGTRITDFTQTSAEVGVPIPFGYGRYPVTGNVIFAALPPKEHRKVQRQGKGGVKQETFTYTLSYAISFCQGPIFGYWWIKRNGKTVWTQDPAAPIEDVAYATKWAEKATMYWGTPTQMPDSTIESVKGTGQVSAFRYLAYIVVEDDDVTDQGGAVPSYEACVIASPPEIFLASRPYPVVDGDYLRNTDWGEGENYPIWMEILADTGFGTRDSTMRDSIQKYESWPAEYLQDTGFDTRGGNEIRTTLLQYESWPAEYLQDTGFGTRASTLS